MSKPPPEKKEELARLIVDGREMLAKSEQTILQACRESGIRIPSLCYDEQLSPIGSCQLCVVELEGHGLITSCTTRVADGMVVETKSEVVIAARKRSLEMLLAEHYGDCVAPCQKACPAGIDIQGYLALIARGAYTEAIELIKERLPLPGVIGRVCPHPCEGACRRALVDDPIPICALKRFASDQEMFGPDKFVPEIKTSTDKRVAIIGAGPAGLSAAYYLLREGHQVTLFESLPKAGGMLRYGIPDYRLPQDVLDTEIQNIVDMGAEIRTNQALGKNVTINGLLKNGYDAIFLAIGAHQSSLMKVEGEQLEGVYPGTNFLRAVVMGESVNIGKRVAVIGGGNTAIDAARTSLRLGATEVIIVYRRSRNEMPATDWEVEEAEEEGVKLHFLAAPTRIVGDNGRVKAIECTKMELGEPDKSGRRSPQPVKGSEFLIPVDSVIAAIGQKPELSPLEGVGGIAKKWGNIIANPDTLLTDMNGVFAGGDCVSGAATAVQAIAAGRKAAMAIMRYLNDEALSLEKAAFEISRGELFEVKEHDFGKNLSSMEKLRRQKMPALGPKERIVDFRQVELGYTEDVARREAGRCLECGCKAQNHCDLRDLSTEYDVKSVKSAQDIPFLPRDLEHPFIERDPNKCIACGRCVKTCQEIQGIGALSLNYRVTSTGGTGPLMETTCVSCGLCVATCPVGALEAKKYLHPSYEVKTVCPYCGVGCGIYLGVRGDRIVSARGDAGNTVNRGNLCVKGRFGHDFIHHQDRLRAPLIKKNGKLVEASWDEALDLVAQKLGKYKGDQFAALASARCTNEENYVFQKFARGVMGTNNIDHCARL